MIDIRLLRTDFDRTKAALARKKVDPADVDRLAGWDVRARLAASERDRVRSEIATASKGVADARRNGDNEWAAQLMELSRQLRDQASEYEAEADKLEAKIKDLLLRIPNVPSDDAPDGDTDADNPLVKQQPETLPDYADHQRVPHWEIGQQLKILDLERAVKISGSMFSMFRGPGATLVRALCQLALDRNADAFEEIRPPTLVTSATLTATGQLPKFADDAYHIARDDLWAVPTAEVPLTSIARDEILDEADLPMRMMAYTPCYRREAGSAGRDTRGLLRVHEFDKVEILAYTTPEQAPAMLDEMVTRAEGTIQALGLAYRIIEICAGDLGQSHHRSYDLEVYAPGCDMWLEVSSVSWFSDYQARRANIRYRPAGDGKGDGKGKGTALIHTLNGSALAVPRVWAALVETHRQADGTIALPEALHPYFRGATTIG